MDRKNLNFLSLFHPLLLNFLPPRKKGILVRKISGAILLGITIFVVTLIISWKMLIYFNSIQLIGPFLVSKILSLILITFFTLLIFSNLITSLGTFFLSSDLQLLQVTPVDYDLLFKTRFTLNTIISSWMVYIFGLPVFIAYGIVFKAEIAYYVTLFIILFPFLIIPASMGKLITELLINAFPVRTLRDLFVIITILFAGGVVLLFRVMRPERLVNPEFLGSIGNYISTLSQGNASYLPSTMMHKIIMNLLEKHPIPWIDILFFLYTGYFFYLLARYSFYLFFRNGLSMAIEGKGARLKKRENSIIGKLSSFLPSFYKEMFLKDWRLFFRDASQWSQLFLLLFLIIIYLYNFSVLPLDKTPINSLYLKNMIGYANLVLAGLVISALGARFIFPSVSLESRSLWLIKGSPVQEKRFIISKMTFNLLPIAVVGFIITFFSCRFLNTTPLITTVSTVTILFLTVSVSTMGIYYGTKYPVLRFENVAQIATSYGGIVYMLITSLFVIGVTTLVSLPTYFLFKHIYLRQRLTFGEYLIIFSLYGSALTIILLSYIIPLKKAVKLFSEMEI